MNLATLRRFDHVGTSPDRKPTKGWVGCWAIQQNREDGQVIAASVRARANDVLSEVVFELAENHSRFRFLGRTDGANHAMARILPEITILSTTSSQKIHHAAISPCFCETFGHVKLFANINTY